MRSVLVTIGLVLDICYVSINLLAISLLLVSF